MCSGPLCRERPLSGTLLPLGCQTRSSIFSALLTFHVDGTLNTHSESPVYLLQVQICPFVHRTRRLTVLILAI